MSRYRCSGALCSGDAQGNTAQSHGSIRCMLHTIPHSTVTTPRPCSHARTRPSRHYAQTPRGHPTRASRRPIKVWLQKPLSCQTKGKNWTKRQEGFRKGGEILHMGQVSSLGGSRRNSRSQQYMNTRECRRRRDQYSSLSYLSSLAMPWNNLPTDQSC